MTRRIALLTSGGDCSGMNAAIRAVVRTALFNSVEVVGIQRGYQGLIDRKYSLLTTRSVSNQLQRGGTFLQSARCKAMRSPEGITLAAETLRGLDVEGLIVIGGGGSLAGADALNKAGIPTIGIPASIDNDIAGTETSLGVDTALNNIIHAIDALKDTASSHARTFVVEVMGRNCGYLALASAIASGAEYAIIPETPYDLKAICANLRNRYLEGRDNSIIIVAEGAGTAQGIADAISGSSNFETRIMVLGHYQRGGSPTAADRMLAARFGQRAVEALLAGERGKMAGLQQGEIRLVEFDEVLAGGVRPIDPMMVEITRKMGQ